MFHGRLGELAAVDAALSAAREGRGGLLVLTGEAGIGKTRLSDEATGRAQARGFRVAWGRTWEGAGAPPCWPWTQIARELIEEGVKVAPAEGAELASIVPDLAGAGERAGDATGFRTFDALLQLLKRAARAQPRLLVLDDLHAADRATLVGLQFIARSLRDLPLVVIATHREGEARLRGDVADLFERIAREGTRLALPRLSEGEVEALLGERIGAAAAESSRAVYRSTEGNPLFVHEVARLLERGGAAELPQGIRAAVAGHVALLEPATQRLLGVAALLGRSFTRAALGEVALAGADEVEVALVEAIEAGVLAASPGGAAFTHTLLAEALTARLPPSERVRLHGAIAAWWIARSEGDARLTEIAHHLLEGGGDPAEAVGWARRAATHAIQHLAYDRAADLYQRAQAFVPRIEQGERVGIELLVGRGEALARAGALEESLELCREAARRARAVGARDLEAQAAIASASYFNYLVPHPEVVSLLERALESIGTERDEGLRARLLALLSCAIYPSEIPGKTADLARQALAIARRIGDPRLSVLVLTDAAISGLQHALSAAERLEMARELHELGLALDDVQGRLRGAIGEAIHRIELGHSEGIDERIRAVDRSLRGSNAMRERALGCLARAMYARLQGRFAEAEACMEESIAVGLPEDELRHRALQLWAMAYTRRNIEDLRAARRMGEIPMPPFGAVFVAAALGEAGEARSRLKGPLPSGDRAAPTMIAAPAEACVLSGDRASADLFYRLIGPTAGELITFGPVIGLGPSDRLLGGLAALRGDRPAAVAHFERAIDLADRTGAAPFLALSLAALGRLLLDERPEEAQPLLDRAHALAASLGMETVAAEVAGIEVRRPPRSRARPPAPEVALARDGETWILSRGDARVVLRDSKGVAYLEELVRHPNREIHVAELYGLGAGAAELSDAGPLLDAEARRQFERRLEDLEEELREAEAFGDQLRASKKEQEIDALSEELARAVGLGGRLRRAGSLTERARINVQRRLRDVLGRVGKSAPELGRYLAATVKTGTWCSYRPST